MTNDHHRDRISIVESRNDDSSSKDSEKDIFDRDFVSDSNGRSSEDMGELMQTPKE